jgi:hypothetical protein
MKPDFISSIGMTAVAVIPAFFAWAMLDSASLHSVESYGYGDYIFAGAFAGVSLVFVTAAVCLFARGIGWWNPRWFPR